MTRQRPQHPTSEKLHLVCDGYNPNVTQDKRELERHIVTFPKLAQ